MKIDKSEKLIEVWGDVVDINSLLRSIIISAVCTMGLYALAPNDDRPLQLLLGLSGAVIAFIINALLFKPKRKVNIEKQRVSVEQPHDND